MMPVQAQTLLVGTIKTRSPAPHAELKLNPHDCLKRRPPRVNCGETKA